MIAVVVAIVVANEARVVVVAVVVAVKNGPEVSVREVAIVLIVIGFVDVEIVTGPIGVEVANVVVEVAERIDVDVDISVRAIVDVARDTVVNFATTVDVDIAVVIFLTVTDVNVEVAIYVAVVVAIGAEETVVVANTKDEPFCKTAALVDVAVLGVLRKEIVVDAVGASAFVVVA